MAPGRKYLMWLDKATHESLSGQGQGGLVQALMALVEGRNTQVVDLEHIDTAVKAVSTAFWFAYLTPNSDLGRQASAWLASDAPKSICKPGDQWSVR
jgi:hypothetical protein